MVEKALHVAYRWHAGASTDAAGKPIGDKMTDEQDDDERLLRDLNSSPINALPGMVWLLVLLIAAIELLLTAAGYGLIGGPSGVGWRIEAIQRFAYSSAVQSWMLETWRFPPMHLVRYLSFPFIHAGAMHAIFAIVLIAALGKMVGERFSAGAFLILAVLVPVLSAIVFGFVMGEDQLGWLFGAMPTVFALVGAFTWMRFRDAQGDRAKQRRAFGMIAVLLGARLAFGVMAETGPGWIAEVAAFAFGFGLSALVLGPGSWQRLRSRIRG